MRRHINTQNIATKVFSDDFMLQQVAPHTRRIGFGLITFIDRNNRWTACCLGMVNCFDGLHHDRVISRHNQNDNISDIRPA